MSVQSSMPRRKARPSAIGSAISDIEPLIQDPNLRRVRVGAKIVATLRASDIELLRLRIGTTWSQELAGRAEQVQTIIKARLHAMKMLGRRARSRTELIAQLGHKGYGETIAAQVADELEADGWLNDREFAQQVAQEVQRTKPAAPRLIRARLAKHGFDQELIDKVANNASADSNAAAMSLANAKLATMRSLPEPTIVRRLASLLARRGYEDDVIEATLERLGLSNER